EITAFVFERINSASQIINSGLEIINSVPDMFVFGFDVINLELETTISGVHMVIVEASIIKCVVVAVFLRTEITIWRPEIIIDAIVAVFSTIVAVFFASVAVKS